MNDGEVLTALAHIREACDGIARTIASHGSDHAATNEGDHSTTECTEGISRLSAGFALIGYIATHATVELSADLAEAVRELLSEMGDDEQEGPPTG